MNRFKTFLAEEIETDRILTENDCFEPVLCEECGVYGYLLEDEMKKKDADEITHGLSYASKMPSATYNLPASGCKTGAKLAQVPGSVCHGCYAKKGNFTFPTVKAGMQKKQDSISHPKWTDAMTTLVKGQAKASPEGQKYFRWHSSGDIQSPEHLEKIFQVARNTPEIHHWLPTHEGAMVAKHLMTSKKPDNLNIRVSANMINGAHPSWAKEKGLTTSGVHTKDKLPAEHHECPSHTQGNVCGSCRACWSPKVQSVSYLKH